VEVQVHVYVDGKLAASSNWMNPKEKPRPLVVGNLKDTKELRLVSCYRKIPPYSAGVSWSNIKFHSGPIGVDDEAENSSVSREVGPPFEFAFSVFLK